MLATSDIDESYMRTWAKPLGVTRQLGAVLAARP